MAEEERLISRHLVQSVAAAKQVQDMLEKLRQEGWREVAPGVLESPDGSCIAEF